MADLFGLASVAEAHGIELGALQASLARSGWDFSPLDQADPTAVAFVARLAADHAKRLAAAIAERAVREAKVAARRQASLTAAAVAHPELQCGRCDGKGYIRGFEHVDSGRCFACGGAGIWRPRSR